MDINGTSARGKRIHSSDDPPGSSQQGSDFARRDRIATAAYYNAERRGFKGSHELDDWLQAEKMVDSMNAQAGTKYSDGVTAESMEYADGADQSNGGSESPEERIEPDKIHEWAQKLDVTEEQLRVAIQRVGPSADRVARFLGNPM